MVREPVTNVRLPIFIGRYCRPIFVVREKSADKACHTTQRIARAPNVNMADSSSDEENVAAAVFCYIIEKKETTTSTKRLGTMLDNEKVSIG